MAKFCPLFSSSSGNSIFISSGNTHILVDCGVSAKKLREALASNGYKVADLSAVFLTHEHSDHIKGLHTLLASTDIPVYASNGTFHELLENTSVLEDINAKVITDDIVFDDLTVHRFSTSHDVAEPCGYRISTGSGMDFCIATDLGYLSDEVKQNLFGCKLVLLESNYDTVMLRRGCYPAQLKKRIASEKGHLSNAECAEFLPQLVKQGTTHLVLGHLSKNNNAPEVAEKTAYDMLDCSQINRNNYFLYVAPPEGGEMIYL